MRYVYEIDEQRFVGYIKSISDYAIDLIAEISIKNNPTDVELVKDDIQTLRSACEQYITSLIAKNESSTSTESEPPNNIISKFEFLQRFTMDELIQLKTSQDPKVQVYMELFNAAQEIDLSNDYVRVAFEYFQKLGLLSEKRVSEILS